VSEREKEVRCKKEFELEWNGKDRLFVWAGYLII